MKKYIFLLEAMLNDKIIQLRSEVLEDIKKERGERYLEGVFKVTAIEDGTIRVWSEAMDEVFDIEIEDIIIDEK